MANLEDQVKVTCYGKTETMSRKDALEKYYDGMRNSEGAENERYQRIFFQLMEGHTECADVEGAMPEPEGIGEMVNAPKAVEEKPTPKAIPAPPVVKAKPTAKTEEEKDDPMMKQYKQLKGKHPDAVLLFRCGDFYQTYEDDAKTCSDILGITLTKSTKNGYRMAGFPHHALDTYLPKLIRAGKRCAICDQLEDPRLTKKLKERGKVTEIVSPGIAPKEEDEVEVPDLF